MKKLLFLFILVLSPMLASANDGDTFSEETVEGVLLKYTIISESEKTCMVGNKYYPAVPTAPIRRGSEDEMSQTPGNITIPENANGYRVVRIESSAFNKAAMSSVIIPNSVETIGRYAFAGCADLKSVRLPEQLEKIEEYTFYGCKSLTSIDIPEGVTSIGDYVFADCEQLKEINIPSSVEHFGGSVFWNTGFTSLPKLPESLTTIPNSMFYGCTQLTSIEIPMNITQIGECAFGRCPISEIEIPASVTHIGVAAFANCINITELTIPDNVTEIGMNAFLGCSNLKTVKLSDNITNLDEGIFSECSSLESVIIPSGVKSIGKFAFRQCSSLGSINLPETVEEIGEQAFFGCSSLKQLFIPKSVVRFKIDKSDDWWSYSYRSIIYGCTNLTSIVVDKDNPMFDSRNNCNAIIETASKTLVAGCIATKIPEGITTIGLHAFDGFQNLTSITLPRSLNRIERSSFNWTGLREIKIPENVTFIGSYAFNGCTNLKDFYCCAGKAPEAEDPVFGDTNINEVTLHVPVASFDAYQATKPWSNFKKCVALTTQDAYDYRPFVADGKVWKVGTISGNPVQVVDHYYFDGDTIINGKVCKQMMFQRYVSPDSNVYWTQEPAQTKVGAWYEEDKKVYFYDENKQSMVIKYDFSIGDFESLKLIDDCPPFMIGPKQIGGIKGFKGVYRNVMTNNTKWLEGVGGIDGPTRNAYPKTANPVAEFLMSCTVGDEVIYLNDEYEDGATPEGMGARKNRFDFTHTIKTKPKAPIRRGEELPLYGEYNDLQLGINLDPLDDAYLVSITDESGKVVYEKAINAGNIVALNIDISAYEKGHYTVNVENSRESFTGQFDAQTTGIKAITNNKEETRTDIYNLQGQRLSSLQKGLNIVNGQKIYVK